MVRPVMDEDQRDSGEGSTMDMQALEHITVSQL